MRPPAAPAAYRDVFSPILAEKPAAYEHEAEGILGLRE
jgi:hypothetical protein